MFIGRVSLFAAFACALVTPALADCLEFRPAIVTVTGVISEHVDFGPPGYGEDPIHDSKVRHLYLKLDKKICVSAKPNDEFNDSEFGVTKLQMEYFSHFEFQKAWLGKYVSVTGTLIHGQTGDDMTKVLIEPSETHVLSRTAR